MWANLQIGGCSVGYIDSGACYDSYTIFIWENEWSVDVYELLWFGQVYNVYGGE